MAVAFQRVYSRSVRRIRVVFSNTLGSAAFSTAFFSISVVDGLAVTPSIVEALIVPHRGNELELALGHDITDGARYRLTVLAGVPDNLAETAPSAEGFFTTPIAQTAANADHAEQRLIDDIFQRDLAHDGNDFVEDASGDLADVGGVENGRSAALRRAASNGLAWDPSYGPGLRKHVDEPVMGLWAVRGEIEANLLLDDRITGASTRIGDAEVNETDGTVVIPVDLEFIGGLAEMVEVPVA